MRVVTILAFLFLAASQALAQGAKADKAQASIALRSGATRSGEIAGVLAFRRVIATPDNGVAYLLVDGKNVSSIDAKGVHLRAGTQVRSLFVEREDLSELASLGVAYRFGKSLGGQIAGRISAGAGCCLLSTIEPAVLTDALLGEFLGDTATVEIIPSLRVTAGPATTTIRIEELVLPAAGKVQ